MMPSSVPVGRLRFDVESLVLSDGNEIVSLAPLPARMLVELLRADSGVVSAARMRKVLWDDAPIEDRNLHQQMYVLRRALRRDPSIAIENVPHRGYRLVVAPATATPWWRSGLGFSWACVAIVLVVVLLRARQSQAEQALFTRDLAAGNYLLTSEGSDHLERAAVYYRAVIAVDPKSSAGYGGLAIIDTRRAVGLAGTQRAQMFATAQSEIAAALQRNAKESNALTAFGIIVSVRDHQTAMAKRMFDEAVAADPTAESPRAWRGKFRLSIGEFDAAGRDFRVNSQNVPTSGSAVGMYGEWLVLDHDYVRASSILSQAVDLGNHPGFTRYWLARSYLQRGLDAQALRLSNVLLALYPNEPAALALRLRIEARHGDMHAAVADFVGIEKAKLPNQTDPLAIVSADEAMGMQGAAKCMLRRYMLSGWLGLDEIDRILTDPDFDSLRKDPRFDVAVRSMTT